MPARRLVLIDRDGVINRDSDEYIKHPDEWIPLPGSLEAIAALTAAGFDVVVITNQSGVGRGLFSEPMLERIHQKMRAAVAASGGQIAAVFYCPHRPDEHCDCRKPKPKLLLQAAEAFHVPLAGVPFIGDKPSDVDAAVAAGARPVFIGKDSAVAAGVPCFPDLGSAVSHLIREAGS